MSNETIVLTGATGFIGFGILQAALKANYNVNIVVRSESKAESLRQNPVLKSLNKSSNCKFFVVPDLGVSGGLDAASEGTTYMIHTASPLPFKLVSPENQYADVVEPAINNTISALESAHKSKTIKRVVITSSCAVYTSPAIFGGPIDSPLTLTEANKNADILPPFHNVMVAYIASKTASFYKSEQWMQDHKPSFDVVNLAPTYVIGRNELATSVQDLMSTSNVLVLRMPLGLMPAGSPAEVASVVHIDDVVELHMESLNQEKIPAQDYLFGLEVKWDEVNEYTKKLFPEQVAQGIFNCASDVETKPVKFGCERTINTFGKKFRGTEEMVKDVMGQFLELAAKEQAAAQA